MKQYTKEEILKNVLELLISDIDQSIEGLKSDAETYTGNLYSVVQNTADEFIEEKVRYKRHLDAVENGHDSEVAPYLNNDVEFLHYLDEYLRGSYDMYKRYGGETKAQEREKIFATLSAINTYGFPVDTRYISMEPVCPDLEAMKGMGIKGKEVKVTHLKDVPDILNVLNTDHIQDFSVIFNPSEKSATARKIITYREAMQRKDLLDREVDTIDLCEEESCLNIWLR